MLAFLIQRTANETCDVTEQSTSNRKALTSVLAQPPQLLANAAEPHRKSPDFHDVLVAWQEQILDSKLSKIRSLTSPRTQW